jgi:hypothetical protein
LIDASSRMTWISPADAEMVRRHEKIKAIGRWRMESKLRSLDTRCPWLRTQHTSPHGKKQEAGLFRTHDRHTSRLATLSSLWRIPLHSDHAYSGVRSPASDRANGRERRSSMAVRTGGWTRQVRCVHESRSYQGDLIWRIHDYYPRTNWAPGICATVSSWHP